MPFLVQYTNRVWILQIKTFYGHQSVTSAGIKIPLPIDSCCSISLVSKKHADLVSQNCPDLMFTKLATPLSVSVASAESKLQAVGMMQIPIVWENGGGGGRSRGDNTICTPFFLQTTFAFTQASFTVPPPLPPPPIKILVVDKTLLGRCFV